MIIACMQVPYHLIGTILAMKHLPYIHSEGIPLSTVYAQ